MRAPRTPRVFVDVTEEKIRSAVTADSSHCMIAESLRSARPDAASVAVDLQTIRFSDKSRGLRYTYLTPRSVQIELLRFEEGILPSPFQFVLRGGHVTAIHPKKSMSDSTKEKLRALAKARIRTGETKGSSPNRVGGKTAPVSRLGNRRGFGLRGLGRAPELKGVPSEMLNHSVELKP